MDRCAQDSPGPLEAACALPDRPHWEHDDAAGHRWANLEVQAAHAAPVPANGLRDIARAAARQQSVRLIAPVRSEPVDPEPGSQAEAVLAHLRSARGWATGAELVSLFGPGSAQRPAELAHAGWPVESRLHPGTVDVWEHRAVPARRHPGPR